MDDGLTVCSEVPDRLFPLRRGELCVVSVDGADEFARVLPGPGFPASVPGEFRRIADAYGKSGAVSNRAAAARARERAEKWVLGRNLAVHIGGARFSAGRERLTLSVCVNGHVELRDLCEALRRELHAAVSLVFLGQRECAAATGGLGPCGRQLCCRIGLGSGEVLLKTAREAGTSLMESSVGGMCGRIKCCFNFEKDAGAQ